MSKSAASRFAHLLGLEKPVVALVAPVVAAPAAAPAPAAEPVAAAPKAADETDDDSEVEDDDKKKGKKAKAKSKAKAEDKDDEDEKCEGDDDLDEEEMRGSDEVAEARSRERGRCAAIFAHPAAAKNPALAASLAFETKNTRSEAIAILSAHGGTAAAPARRESLAARNAAAPPAPLVRAESGESTGTFDYATASAADRAKACIAAAASARGETVEK